MHLKKSVVYILVLEYSENKLELDDRLLSGD
jgi:hypothetical protein